MQVTSETLTKFLLPAPDFISEGLRVNNYLKLLGAGMMPVLAGIIILLYYLGTWHDGNLAILVIELIILWTLVGLGFINFAETLKEVHDVRNTN